MYQFRIFRLAEKNSNLYMQNYCQLFYRNQIMLSITVKTVNRLKLFDHNSDKIYIMHANCCQIRNFNTVGLFLELIFNFQIVIKIFSI